MNRNDQNGASTNKKPGALLDLVVVLVVLGVVLCVFQGHSAESVREKSKRSICLNNMKECATAVLVYLDSFDSVLPSSAIQSDGGKPTKAQQVAFCTGNGNGGTAFPPDSRKPRVSWAQCVYDMMKTRDIMYCVSDSNKDLGNKSPCLSYWWKTAIDSAWNGVKPARKESNYCYMASQVLLYERCAFHGDRATLANGATVNCAYLDSHVKTITLKYANNCTGGSPSTDVFLAGEPAYFCWDEEKNAPLPLGRNCDPRKQSDQGL